MSARSRKTFKADRLLAIVVGLRLRGVPFRLVTRAEFGQAWTDDVDHVLLVAENAERDKTKRHKFYMPVSYITPDGRQHNFDAVWPRNQALLHAALEIRPGRPSWWTGRSVPSLLEMVRQSEQNGVRRRSLPQRRYGA